MNFRRKGSLIALLTAASLAAAALVIWPARATRAQAVGKTAPSSWTLTTLYAFRGSDAGQAPVAGLIHDAAGNLYGTAAEGGDLECDYGSGFSGCGVVFKLDSNGMGRNLHVFTGSPDGAMPAAPLVHDAAGNFYGTTLVGGAGCQGYGCGTIFKVAPGGRETILYSFTGTEDGATPNGVILDPAGNLYGTTLYHGSVFELNRQGHLIVVHSFDGGAGGGGPTGSLIPDSEGNLYGTTTEGGLDNSACGAFGCGVVYKVDRAGNETVLYSFTGGADGGNPYSTLIRDSQGNLYGTTTRGGNTGCGTEGSCGVLFEVHPNGEEEVLYAFTGRGDGGTLFAGVIADANGNLYGNTDGGGAVCGFDQCGVVYKVDRTGKETVLYSFTSEAGVPYATGVLLRDSSGNLYGTGVAPSIVFKLSPPQREQP